MKLETLNEVKAWFMNLYSNCVAQFNEKKLNRVNTIVKAVTNYIDENYPNPSISPESIADHVNISSNYLRTIFKNTVNKSLSIYISEVRFNKAKFLLETTDLTVSEISTAVGFSNTNYFYTAFKKNYGISPNHYRNTYKST
ncbi:helix-turn-helix transcriptional regulator [Clostridium aciditolerans]|uniref:Helix-turn-helix transcriptional regulator n=1 Tax=Clostridium aciditolerans TaxID=339861 RepID=A0A934HXF1_9CLOT|nr:AraC family transcriptional regulator [Clostridium aciditolerans]MBI6873799.1 helix-turn-helix transcriptional regulator [Clostridium aciditolerans]